MRILGVGQSCDLGDMYLRLLAQGHEVRVFASELEEHGTMRGMLPHVADYRAELAWLRAAGDDGVAVFETAEHGAEQDALRREGYFVIGGSAFGDRLENERAFGQSALTAAGLRSIPMHEFHDFEAAADFVRRRPKRYVFKLNGSGGSSWRNFVGQAQDGADMLALLRTQRARLLRAGFGQPSFVLVDHVEGVETGIGAYFDGHAFLEPACLDWEHKRFFPGDVGELTGEMGTLVTYRDSETLFRQTLHRLTPQLREHGYVGYINLNTIINEEGIWPLELTCRFGYPGYAILDALQCDGWAEIFRLLRAGAASKGSAAPASFRTLPGYAVGVVLSVPPYPYRYGYEEVSRGLPIVLSESLSAEERAALHFGEVDTIDGQLVTSGVIGYTMVANGVGQTVEAAQQRAYALAQKVYVPNLRYRNDIGSAFLAGGRARLQRLGYLAGDQTAERKP